VNELRRNELAAFLRSRRERISPGDVGLPSGQRRRTAGLRREEVAQLAGVGVTWYTWLEQGRPIHASAQVLEAVARTLRLDPVERQHLFRLAELPDAALDVEDCLRLSPHIQPILDALGPLPSHVLTERWDILAWNAAYEVLFPRTPRYPPSERNAIYKCFSAPSCCRGYENSDEQRAHMVAQLRGNYAHHIGDPAWTSFIKRMEAASAEFSAMWAKQDVAHTVSLEKVFRHPLYPRLPMTSTSFAIQSAPGTRMVVYTPADDDTRRAMERLVAGEGTGARWPCDDAHRARELELAGSATRLVTQCNH
jgi:transcriptional regulator with XRE-family HTH domain